MRLDRLALISKDEKVIPGYLVPLETKIIYDLLAPIPTKGTITKHDYQCHMSGLLVKVIENENEH